MRYPCFPQQRIVFYNFFFGLTIYLLISFFTFANADSLAEQREHYQEINRAWDRNQMDTVNQLFPTLKTYPLLPYLLYRGLLQEIDQVNPAQVNSFLSRYSDFPFNDTLSTRFIQALAKKQDWNNIVAFSQSPPNNTAAQCNYYYAQWQTAHRTIAYQGAKSLWLTGDSMPNECDNLFAVWQQGGQLSSDLIFQRILLAMKEGNSGLVTHLVNNYLPSNQHYLGYALLKLQNNPQSLATFAQNNGPNSITQQATQIAFSRLARQNSDKAQSLLNSLISWQKLNSEQQQKIKESLAWQYMDPDTPSWQQQWRDQTIIQSHSVDLIERRIRLAIAANDTGQLAIWLSRLPAQAQQKDEWRYWQGYVLLQQGHQQEGRELLNSLTQGRGFYPMAAAQKIGRPYPIKIEKVSSYSPNVLAQLSSVQRVHEWLYWNNDIAARREWRQLLLNSSAQRQAELAQYAFNQGWANLSIQATIVGKLWNHLQQRFPIAWQQNFVSQTDNKTISASYAMAIARQESALDPEAMSAVGARGLMQIMPATAKHIVHLSGMSGYHSPSQLLDPVMNIRLGTSYLDYVYQQFDNNRILASAAYNAGPSRVKRWLGNSANALDPVAFIETIPFSETRGYVKNVLTYDMYYRYFLHRQTTNLFQLSEWQRHY